MLGINPSTILNSFGRRRLSVYYSCKTAFRKTDSAVIAQIYEIPCPVKAWISWVRSMLRLSVFLNTKPINHMVLIVSLQRMSTRIISWLLKREKVLEKVTEHKTYGSGCTGSNCSGFMWANVIWSLRSSAKIKCRILDSTSPTHSSWSSTLEELAIRTIKCLKVK